MAPGAARPESLILADDGVFPNSSLPALVYRGAVTGEDIEAATKALFARNQWPPQWVDGVFDYHHYHSTSHEVLGVIAGHALIRLGGPHGETVALAAGDVVVIPAGVAHKREEASGDFAVVGAYPPGCDWDVLTGEPGEREKALDAIAQIPLPESDPVLGKDGALVQLWQDR